MASRVMIPTSRESSSTTSKCRIECWRSVNIAVKISSDSDCLMVMGDRVITSAIVSPTVQFTTVVSLTISRSVKMPIGRRSFSTTKTQLC